MNKICIILNILFSIQIFDLLLQLSYQILANLVCYSQQLALLRSPGERRLTPQARMTRILFLQLSPGWPAFLFFVKTRAAMDMQPEESKLYKNVVEIVYNTVQHNGFAGHSPNLRKTFHLKTVNISDSSKVLSICQVHSRVSNSLTNIWHQT